MTKSKTIPLDTKSSLWYCQQRNGGVAKLVIASACQAEDRGFKPRRSRFRRPFGSAFYFGL